MQKHLTKYEEGAKVKGVWNFTIRDAKTGKIKRVLTYKNIIPTISRTQMTKALAADLSVIEDIEINFHELGTGVTAPANGDTGLETPDAATRGIISSSSAASNVLNLVAFFSAGIAVGTFKEFATFMNGTGTSNSGTLFNRVAIDVTVSVSETLTVDGTITFT